ncbi:hypothetical protein [Oceanirhabdus sp. W0125-5]|uniref:hypothetical protein n=1 Tax=Oceanirhabdus sp. W0125-5 TaxID=2999116 RepID=UPI0022F327BF|nr:hypothetical protein [Oceanirhabdus sp. W0125-5]WBW97460.1 hypothetical protein OW730_00975 [Oceanirhabdus sp. W0125-5]
MKKFKVLISTIVLSLLCSTVSFAQPIESGVENKKLMVFDSKKANEKANKKLIKGYQINYTTNTKNDIGKSSDIAININDLFNEKSVLNKAIRLMKQGNIIFIYGEDLDIDSLEEALGIEIDGLEESEYELKQKETKWDIIGIMNGQVCNFGNIQYTEESGDIKVDTFINDIISIRESESIKNNMLAHQASDSMLAPSEKMYSLSSASDIEEVKSYYGLTSSIYLPSGTGSDKEVARIVSDLILSKEKNPQDPTNTKFALKNNAQVLSYQTLNPYGTTEFNTTHKLMYSSDELQGWGPGNIAETSGTITVGLPWGINYAFTSTGEYSIKTSPLLQEDQVKWKVWEPSVFGVGQPLDSNATISPGIAWTSDGSTSGALVTHEATVRELLTSKEFTFDLNKSIKYFEN